MKNTYIFLILGFLLLGAITLYAVRNGSSEEQPSQNKALQVAASFYPLAFFASEIGKEKVHVSNITPAGVEPHDYDPTPQDVVRIQESKLLIVNGAGFEPWLDKLKDELKMVTIVNTAEGVAFQESTEEHAEEEEQGHEGESDLDPHIWLSPVIAKAQVDKILQGYRQVDSQNSAFYEANAEELKRRLEELDRKFEQGLRSCKQRSFVTSHAAFGYLAREYNLTQVPISGLSPDEEPSPAQLAQVTEFVKEHNIQYIFFETLVSPKLSETIAQEVGAQTLVLDPIEGLSDDDIKQGENYFTVMESNLKNLQIALECSK
jgi:zinc transport system substrate-binding protein